MAQLRSDVRLALRSWRKSPTFTAIVVASIALGIGANTAIFTLVDQVLLRTLPVRDPAALVQVTFEGVRYGNNWGDGSELSYPTYAELRDRNDIFDGMFGRFNCALHIGYAGRTERVAGELVTGTYFPVLGVGAAIGRTLTPDDDKLPGGHPVAVLSHGFWTSRFAADPAVLGTPLVVNGHPYTVVGVARAGFAGIELGRPAQVFVPMMMKAQITPSWNALDDRLYRWVRTFARLKPGVTADYAQAALQPHLRAALERDLAERNFSRADERLRSRYRDNQVRLVSAAQGRSGFRRALTTPLWVLMAIATGVLLIACANVANLLLARAAGRQREMAIRLALGGTRRRLMQQLLVESVLLALAGGLAGLAIAAVGAPLVLSLFVNPETPAPISTAPDGRILAFTFAVSTLTGLLFGLAPAFHSTRPDVAPTLKDQAGSVVGGGQARFRKSLVAAQVAVSLLLLISAVLFIRTLNNLLAVDIGFEAGSLISFTVDPSLNGYAPARGKQFAKSLLERLTGAPGVTGAGFATQRLLDGSQWSSSMTVEGYRPSADESVNTLNNAVSPGYFRAMGIPVLMGRDFSERDERLVPPGQGAPDFRVVIANETFVRRYLAGRVPLGRRLGFGSDPNTPTPMELIGVVRDSKYRDVRDAIEPQLFFPYFEAAASTPSFTVYVRSSQPPDTMFTLVRQTVRDLDPNLPVSATRTLDTQVKLSLRNERMIATLSAIFGALATLLAVVGLYGVMSYTVARRTREIGIRMALGARAADIGRMVIREVVAIAAAGVAIGVPAAWWLSRYVESVLYGVTARDLTTMAGAVALLGMVSILAGLVPSTRAARVEPTTALRYE